MPVQKFRTFEDAERALWTLPFGAEGPQRIRRLWHRAAVLSNRRYPTGVRKYLTLEDAEADRERWLAEPGREGRQGCGAPAKRGTDGSER